MALKDLVIHKSKGWAILGKRGLYPGAQEKRKDAIKAHMNETGIYWEDCERRGDKVVKVEITTTS